MTWLAAQSSLCLIASFGIGTFLTNDFHSLSSGGREKSKALNMVIKLNNVDGQHCVKISDELTKVCYIFRSHLARNEADWCDVLIFRTRATLIRSDMSRRYSGLPSDVKSDIESNSQGVFNKCIIM